MRAGFVSLCRVESIVRVGLALNMPKRKRKEGPDGRDRRSPSGSPVPSTSGSGTGSGAGRSVGSGAPRAGRGRSATRRGGLPSAPSRGQQTLDRFVIPVGQQQPELSSDSGKSFLYYLQPKSFTHYYAQYARSNRMYLLMNIVKCSP